MAADNKVAFPSEDKRWKVVNGTMRKNGYSPAALIETLHTFQESFGFIDDTGLKYIAESLNIPYSKVYGVATFYNLFSMKPLGRHTITVCTGTACYVKGSDKILQFLKEEYNLEPGQTTPDNELSFTSARCVGACGLAPVMILDGEVVGKLNVEEMKQRIREWIAR